MKLQNVVPPAGPVQAAYEDVNKAIQDRDRSINEGIEAYNQAIPKATARRASSCRRPRGTPRGA